MTDQQFYLAMAGIGVTGAAAILKVVLPYVSKKNGNGGDLGNRIEKSFEQSLKILVIPHVERTNEIMERQIKESEKMLAVLTKLALRQEVEDRLKDKSTHA